jgi:hypothetical protein
LLLREETVANVHVAEPEDAVSSMILCIGDEL